MNTENELEEIRTILAGNTAFPGGMPSAKSLAEILVGTIALLEQKETQARNKLAAIDNAVDGYVDGAPDCNAVSKLANEVSAIIHPA